MNANNHSEVIDRIRYIKLDNEFPPREVSELPELIGYGHFFDIVEEVQLGNLRFHIPNHKLYDIYNYLVTRKERLHNSLIVTFPYLFSLAVTVYGLIVGNYWLLILIPTVFIVNVLSSFLDGMLSYLGLLLASIYFFYSGSETLGFITLASLISAFCASYFKNHRRNTLLRKALSNEEIFCFLFYSKALTVFDVGAEKSIYSGIRS